MGLLPISAVLISLAAVLAFFNYRVLGLPTSIGVMLLSLLFSAALVAADFFGPGLGVDLGIHEQAQRWLQNIDFNKALMDGMLSFLLFAGAMHVNLGDLWTHRFSIGMLASVGVVLSTAIIGAVTYYLVSLFGFDLPLIYCLLFGALISPTDPIAVLSILKQAGASEALETNIRRVVVQRRRGGGSFSGIARPDRRAARERAGRHRAAFRARGRGRRLAGPRSGRCDFLDA